MLDMNWVLLILRLVVGLLFAGHGAQKLFGWFGGRGIQATEGFFGNLGLVPVRFWTYIGSLAEFLGGLGLALGLLTPLAAAGLVGVMLMAIIKVHWAKGVWNTQGGFEYPLVNLTVAALIGLAGPGIYSLDHALGLEFPLVVFIVLLVLVLLGVLFAVSQGARVERRA